MRNCQLPNPSIHFHLFFNNRINIQPCAQLKNDRSQFLLQIHVVYDQLLVNKIYAKTSFYAQAMPIFMPSSFLLLRTCMR